ncbi:ZIP family metal transporter [Candidatus Pacearchaeota archaeon]|nr:ZIP family metal transporter [Candidatus Pacearchaeota archaeon]
MYDIWFWSLLSVFVVSLLSFVGLATFGVQLKKLKTVVIYLISFAAGALLGDVFLHLLPEAVEEAGGFVMRISLGVLGGMVLFFLLEKVIHWRHCHMPIDEKEHVHAFAYTNLIGDALHNFLDGVLIAGAFLVNWHTGIATALAVMLHEIPQEIGDFGVLLHGGFTRKRALWLNFLTALAAVVGAIVTLLVAGRIEGLVHWLLPLAAGGFIYIATADLIPELHKDATTRRSLGQVLAFILGIAVMASLLFVE